MAEALAKHYWGRSIWFDSCGVVAGNVDGFAIAAMAELGMDISEHIPKTFEDLQDDNYDLIIALSPNARAAARVFAGHNAVEVVFWPIDDPTEIEGNREQRMKGFIRGRDDLDLRIRKAFRTAPKPFV